MSIRFSTHAIKRFNERFSEHSHKFKVVKLIESAATKGWARRTKDGLWRYEDFIEGRRVRVIFIEHSQCDFEIVTVMWCP